MTDFANEIPNQNDCDNQAKDYIKKAAEACAAGDYLLGLHLYLAAHEKAAADPSVPANVEVTTLHEAWHLACDLKERSMAEYVFEKLEPYLTGKEIAECAMKLQELALDRLEEYGFSREELEDMAETISQDLIGEGGHVVKVESMTIPNMGMFGVPDAAAEAAPVIEPLRAEADSADASQPAYDQDASEDKPARPPHVGMNVAKVNDFNPYDMYQTSSVGTSYHNATNEGAGSYVFTRDEDRASELERAKREAAEQSADPAAEMQDAPEAQTGLEGQGGIGQSEEPVAPDGTHVDDGSKVDLSKFVSKMPVAPEETGFDSSQLNYRTLAGYDEAISIMHDLGVGMKGDAEFLDFVRMLNSKHGLDRMPSVDTLLFRAAAIEDAMRFVEATAGELGLPVLRMSMEEGMGGAPVLCVTTQGNNRPRMNHAHNRFDGPGILVIEDLDTWGVPEMPENSEGFAGFMMANISRGAREAISLIRSAVEDPDVYVLATSSTVGEADPFFYELLEPITIVDIGYPNEKERADIWADIARNHPSMRSVNRDDLVRFSEGMARYDMYMAAREAVEDAYKMGLVQRSYVPVSPQNLFDKIAACHPLDSETYHALEQAVIDDFRNDIDHLEDLLDGSE